MQHVQHYLTTCHLFCLCELDDHNFTFMRAVDYFMNDPGKTLNGSCLVASLIPTLQKMAFRLQRLPLICILMSIFIIFTFIILDPNLSMDKTLNVTLLSFEYMKMIRNHRFLIT